MGVGCCMKIEIPKCLLLQQKLKQERESSFPDLKAYYKNNKKFMPEKIRLIYKQINKTEKYDSEIVNLNFVSLQIRNAEFLLRVIPYFDNLHALKLWKSGLGSSGMKIISGRLRTLTSLEVLSLEDNSLGAEGCSYLSSSLKDLIKLKELWLHSNDIGSVGAFCLAEALQNLKYLEKLGLDENNMENQGTTKLITAIGNLKYIKLLTLSYNMLTEDTCLNIAVKLSTIQIDKLTMSGNYVTDATQSKIMALLPKTLLVL